MTHVAAKEATAEAEGNIEYWVCADCGKIFADKELTKELKKEEKVQLVGFGTFEVSKRAARTGKNPQTGEPMTISACNAPKFKAGKALKDAVN